LSAEDRWRRVLAEALKKYLGGRQPWLQPPGTRSRDEIAPEDGRIPPLKWRGLTRNCRS